MLRGNLVLGQRDLTRRIDWARIRRGHIDNRTLREVFIARERCRGDIDRRRRTLDSGDDRALRGALVMRKRGFASKSRRCKRGGGRQNVSN